MKRYAIIEGETGSVCNIILWDEVTPYDPGKGFSVRVATEADRSASTEIFAPEVDDSKDEDSE